MNVRRRLAQLECLAKRRPRALPVEQMTDEEIYRIMAQGTSFNAKELAALSMEEFAAVAELLTAASKGRPRAGPPREEAFFRKV